MEETRTRVVQAALQVELLVAGAALVGLYLAARSNYLLFHSLAEGFSIVVGCGVFMLAWTARRLLQSHYLLFLGIACLFVGVLDGAHTLTYVGMGIFPDLGTNTATQLWIAARFMQGLSLLLAPVFLFRELKPERAIAVYLVISAAVIASISTGWFPVCFVEGEGLTPFKKVSEYVICLVLLGAVYTTHRAREHLDPRIVRLVTASILAAIVSELSFTLYLHAYALPNMVGHLLKVVAFYLLYRAIIETGLVKPYDLLFRELAEARERLEQKVTLRTAELSESNRQLLEEVEARRRSEHALGERVKELRCLFELSRIVESRPGSVDELLKRTVHLLPAAWQFSEDAVAVIRFGEQLYTTGPLEGCPSRLAAKLAADGQTGSVEVAYRKELPFLPEERDLLTLLAERLGHIIGRMETEQALRRSEEMYRLLADNSLDVIWAMDPELRFTYVNPAVALLTGRPPEEWIGTPLKEHLNEVDVKFIDAVIEQTLSGGQADQGVVLETRMRGVGGALVDVEVHARALLSPEGELRGFQGISRDITQRKQAERERSALEAQLEQAAKLEAMGRLAGGVAHDFNNMLGVILGNADLALEKLDPADPLFQELQEIQVAGQRSAELTRQLLAFARKQIISPVELELNQAIDSSLKMLSRLAGEAIHLVWEPGEALPAVKLDPGQVNQVLANLVLNARDAIGGFGTVTIATGRAEFAEHDHRCPPGKYVTLAVRDTGCGMDKETLSHIFEPFFTTKESGQGTGLGLATVHGIVTQSGGFLEVDSRPGQGTTFTLYFPACEEHASARHAIESRGTIPAAERTTILLVEDEPSLLKLTGRLLRSLGYKVLSADAPERAIELFERRSQEIDLLVTDVVMPGMNGRELYRRLSGGKPQLKVLFMSGYTDDVILRHGIEDREVHFLEKPFSREDLGLRVHEALNDSRAVV